MFRRFKIGRMPDPARAHGAWVYLILSVLAGGLTAAGGGAVPALLTGVGFAGVFLVASSLAIGWRKARRRLLIGVLVAFGPPLLAIRLGADPIFFAYALVAVFPAGLSAWLAERQGFQSPAALAAAVAALVVAAPCAACAGGASFAQVALLFTLLAPFFVWRTLTVRRLLATEKNVTGARLRARGWREALYGVAWTFLAVGVIHLLG